MRLSHAQAPQRRAASAVCKPAAAGHTAVGCHGPECHAALLDHQRRWLWCNVTAICCRRRCRQLCVWREICHHQPQGVECRGFTAANKKCPFSFMQNNKSVYLEGVRHVLDVCCRSGCQIGRIQMACSFRWMTSLSHAALRQRTPRVTAPLCGPSEQVRRARRRLSRKHACETAIYLRKCHKGAQLPDLGHRFGCAAGQRLDIKLPMQPRLETLQVLHTCCLPAAECKPVGPQDNAEAHVHIRRWSPFQDLSHTLCRTTGPCSRSSSRCSLGRTCMRGSRTARASSLPTLQRSPRWWLQYPLEVIPDSTWQQLSLGSSVPEGA